MEISFVVFICRLIRWLVARLPELRYFSFLIEVFLHTRILLDAGQLYSECLASLGASEINNFLSTEGLIVTSLSVTRFQANVITPHHEHVYKIIMIEIILHL